MTIDEAIKRYVDNAEYERTHDLQGCLEFKQLVKWLKELKQLRKQTRWISCNERLPELPGTYMTTLDYGKHGIATVARYYHGKYFKWMNECVIAWMPLPEPYKVETEGEACKGCHYNDGEVRAECVVCDKAEMEGEEDGSN